MSIFETHLGLSQLAILVCCSALKHWMVSSWTDCPSKVVLEINNLNLEYGHLGVADFQAAGFDQNIWFE